MPSRKIPPYDTWPIVIYSVVVPCQRCIYNHIGFLHDFSKANPVLTFYHNKLIK